MAERTEIVRRINLLSRLQLDRFKRTVIIEETITRLREEESEMCADIDAEITSVEKEVRADVVSLGETVKGADLWAVYNQGRVTWDTAGLDGYAKARPEVLEFKKMGAPYITIRKAAE